VTHRVRGWLPNTSGHAPPDDCGTGTLHLRSSADEMVIGTSMIERCE